MLGHNRASGSTTEIWEYQSVVKSFFGHNRFYVYRYEHPEMRNKNKETKNRNAQCLTWKPEQGKTTWSPQTPKQITMREGNTIRNLWGNNLEVLLRLLTAMERTRFHSHSSSLSLAVQLTHRQQPVHQHSSMFCPKYLYTYTTLWLFTYMAHVGHTFRLFTIIVSRVGHIHDSPIRPRPSSTSTRLLSLPIRRDQFPNTIGQFWP